MISCRLKNYKLSATITSLAVKSLKALKLAQAITALQLKCMAKKIKTQIKLQIPAGKATPAPPVGPALGQHGLNISDFVNKFNAATKELGGDIIPVVITVYEDRTFTFVMKTPPASELLKKAAKLEKGSGKPLQEKVGKIKRSLVREIALKKMPDLNTTDVSAAMRTIEGTARQMGLEVVEG